MDEIPQTTQQQPPSYTSESIRADINPIEMKITKPVLVFKIFFFFCFTPKKIMIEWFYYNIAIDW